MFQLGRDRGAALGAGDPRCRAASVPAARDDGECARGKDADELPGTRRGHTWDPFGNQIELIEAS